MKKNSFTILEVMLAIFVLTTAVGASFALIQQTLVAASISQSKLVAYYLAQEGIEIVRNIRDNNWLLQGSNRTISWKNGLTNGVWEADYSNLTLSPNLNRNLYIEGASGFYKYISSPLPGDVETSYKRTISITEIGDSALEVKTAVEWKERGRTHDIEVVDRLYNWYGY